jgi:hypothetical protein
MTHPPSRPCTALVNRTQEQPVSKAPSPRPLSRRPSELPDESARWAGKPSAIRIAYARPECVQSCRALRRVRLTGRRRGKPGQGLRPGMAAVRLLGLPVRISEGGTPAQRMKPERLLDTDGSFIVPYLNCVICPCNRKRLLVEILLTILAPPARDKLCGRWCLGGLGCAGSLANFDSRSASNRHGVCADSPALTSLLLFHHQKYWAALSFPRLAALSPLDKCPCCRKISPATRLARSSSF